MFLKNVAGQSVGAQMVNASTGANFTGTVTVFVTIDNGTQALGTVGAGVCTHEGNGWHSYAPDQAETNGDHIAFTFTGTGAVSAGVQVYTLPKSIADELADYGALQPTIPGRQLEVSALGSAAIDWANVENPNSVVLLTNTTIGSVLNLDTDGIADAVLTRDWTLVTGAAARSLLNAGRFLRNRWIVSLGTITVYEEDDTTVAWTGSTIGTAGADPITSVDPA